MTPETGALRDQQGGAERQDPPAGGAPRQEEVPAAPRPGRGALLRAWRAPLARSIGRRPWVFDVRRVRRRIEHNFLLKLFSLIFAIGLWAFVNLGARDTERALFVPLEIRNLPRNFMLTTSVPDSVDVRVRGPRTLLGSINERRERAVLDLSNVRVGTTSFKIDASLLSLPRGVRAVRISPEQITLDVDRIAHRTVPVTPTFAPGGPSGYRVAESEVRPAMVSVRGPARDVENMKSISTEPIRLTSAAMFEESAALERPTDLVQLTPDRVVVRARVEEVPTSAEFRRVEIGVRHGPGPFSIRPTHVDVRLRGPQRLFNGLRLSAENVYVDAEGLAPGSHREKIEMDLPDGVDLVEVRPSEATVVIPSRPARTKVRPRSGPRRG